MCGQEYAESYEVHCIFFIFCCWESAQGCLTFSADGTVCIIQPAPRKNCPHYFLLSLESETGKSYPCWKEVVYHESASTAPKAFRQLILPLLEDPTMRRRPLTMPSLDKSDRYLSMLMNGINKIARSLMPDCVKLTTQANWSQANALKSSVLLGRNKRRGI